MPPAEFAKCDPLAAYRRQTSPSPGYTPSTCQSDLRQPQESGLLPEAIADFPQFCILEHTSIRKLLKNSKLMLFLALALSVQCTAVSYSLTELFRLNARQRRSATERRNLRGL